MAIQGGPQTSIGKAPVPGLSPARAEELAIMFRALADSTRVQIVSLLLAAGESGVCVCDIVDRFSLGQPTISYHLKMLKDADLLCARKKGLWVYYSVNKQALSRFGVALPVFSDSLERSRCEDDSCDPLPDAKEVL
ncbi:MAG: metalloregulator ArsR/SmtB family transcription factor [Dehalococcoidia bacterium]|nr:metalloregulator ArsR/SmtB family transcription factor [Dehalococcoidia bacterium]